MKKTLSLLLLLSLVLSLASCGQKTTTDDPVAAATLAESYQSYLDTAEPSYAYDIALELTTNPEYFNAEQGGRNAGSDAEHAAADYLVGVMQDIGLADVEKQAAQCDRWQFNSASLTIDGKDYNVYTYATASTPAEGLTAEVVYVNKGTRQDYEGLDVTGRSSCWTSTSATTGGSPIPCWRPCTRAQWACWRPTSAALPRSPMMRSTARTSAALWASPPCPSA